MRKASQTKVTPFFQNIMEETKQGLSENPLFRSICDVFYPSGSLTNPGLQIKKYNKILPSTYWYLDVNVFSSVTNVHSDI